MKFTRASVGWLVLAAVTMVEVAVIVPLIAFQRDRDVAQGAASISTFTSVFGVRALRVLRQMGYANRRTAAMGLQTSGNRSILLTQFQYSQFNQIESVPFVSSNATVIFAWMPVVYQHERAKYEAFYGFPILGFNVSVNLTVAPARPFYVPITLLDPPQPSNLPLGLDLHDDELAKVYPGLIRNGTATYLVPLHATLPGKGPNRWGVYLCAYNSAADAFALSRFEAEDLVDQGTLAPRDQVTVAAYGVFPDEAMQLLFKDDSPLLEGATSIRLFNQSRHRDRFQVFTVDAYGDQLLFAVAYTDAFIASQTSRSWVTLAVILVCVCVVVDAVVLLLTLMWQHRVAMHRREARRHSETQQMMGYVSHEIRNPLQTILGMADMELEQDGDGEHAASWKAVMKSASAIEGIANDVLNVRRMQEGGLTCHAAELDLEALFADLGHAVEPLLQPDVRFDAVIDTVAAQVTVRSDPHRLRQILLNFLTNAAKFTHHGAVTLEFSVVSPRAGRFTVRDTGRGIPEDKQEALFRQFQQVEAEDAHNGFGLGLYLCRMLAKLLGVELGFRSVAGEGAEFWLTLPLEARVWADFEQDFVHL